MGGVIPTQDNIQMTDAGLIGKSTPGVGLSGRMDAAAIRAFIGSLTQSQIEALIAGAIAALVDSSPGTLDTLNELAAALGDDPNFAATTAAAIGAKANSSITITAGTGLSGGGDLSTNRTLSLANTAVTPGNYTAANVTVDAQGRITAAANGSAGIGGSTGATDNRVLRSDGTGGATVQNSPVTIDDSGNVSGVTSVTSTGSLGLAASSSSTPHLSIADNGLVIANSLTVGTTTGFGAGFGVNRNSLTGSILNSGIGAMQVTVNGSQAGIERYLGAGGVVGTLLLVPMGGAASGIGLGFNSGFANASPSLGIYPDANGFQINNGTAGTLRDLSCRSVIGGSGTIGVLRSSVNPGRGFGFAPGWGEPVITFDGTHVFAANTWAVTVGSSLSLMFSSSGSDLQGSYLTGLRPTSGQIEVRNAANNGSGNLLAANITASGDVTVPAGSAAAPSLRITQPSGTTVNGFYSHTAPSVSLSINATPVMQWNSTTYINIHSSVNMGFSAGGNANNVNADIGWGRSAAGVLEINDGNFNGTKGTYRDLIARAITATALMCAGSYTVATLPSASANAGKFLRISDRAQKHAYSDGTNWRFFGDDAIIS